MVGVGLRVWVAVGAGVRVCVGMGVDVGTAVAAGAQDDSKIQKKKRMK